MEQKGLNPRLNFLKAFACIGVIFIHVSFPGILGQIFDCLSAYAVPLFCMIAGYYAWEKGIGIVKRRLMKIVKIFLYAYIVHLLYNLADAVLDHEIGTWMYTQFNWRTPIKYIVFCTIDFARPLWYLIAMIELYVVWYLVVKHRKERFMLKFIPLLFGLQILLTSYCETMQLDWFWKINFVTRAMPWFLLGYFIHSDKAIKWRNLEFYQLIMLIVLGAIITVIPIVCDLPLKFNTVGYIPYTFGLFTLALKEPHNSICKIMEFIGEKLSLNIYILHMPISGVISVVCRKVLGIDIKSNLWLWIQPIIVMVCTIFVSWIIYFMLNKVRKIKMTTL